MKQTVIPAYGRDYRSLAKARIDWERGMDFLMQPQQRHINKQDADAAGMDIWIRYAGGRKIGRVCE